MLRRKKVLPNRRNRRKRVGKIIGILCLIIGIFFAGFMLLLRKSDVLIRPIPEGPFSQVLGSSDGTVKQIEKALKEQKIAYKEVKKASEASHKVILSSGEEVLLSDTKDLGSQLSSLQVIISRLTMEGKRFSKLDLRFDRPAIMLVK